MEPDFRDLIGLLLECRAHFLVVGAHALAAHGTPRATGDLDIWVRPSAANARRVFAALAKFGAPLTHVSQQDLTNPSVVIQFGVPPLRIDLMSGISGVKFISAWRHRICVEVDGLSVPIIGREDLIRNKLAAGRPKDLVDANTLSNKTSPPKKHRHRR